MSGSSGGLFQATRNSDGSVIKGTKTWTVPFQFNVIAYWDIPPGELDVDYATFSFQGWSIHAYSTAYYSPEDGVQLLFWLDGYGPGHPLYASFFWNPTTYYSSWNFQATVTGTLVVTMPYVVMKSVANIGDSHCALPEDQLTYFHRLDVTGTWSAELQASASTTSNTNIIPPTPSSLNLAWLNQTPPQDYHVWESVFGNRFTHSLTTVSEDGDEIIAKVLGTTYADSRASGSVPLDLTCSGSGSDVTVTGDSSGNFTVDHNNGGPNPESHTAVAVVDAPTTVVFDGLVTQEFHSNFGASVSLDTSWNSTVSAAYGIYTPSAQTWKYRLVTLDGTTIASAPVIPDFYLNLNSAWASSNGVPSNDTYVRLLDDNFWSPTTFSHAASFTAENFASLTGWTGTNANVTSSGGLRITATDLSASAQKSTYTLDFRNYRYLRVHASANNAGTQGRVVFLNLSDPAHGVTRIYSFTLANDMSGHDFDIDLCAPINGVFGTDPTDTSWATPGMVSGLQKVTLVVIEGLQTGDDVTIASLTLVRKGIVSSAFPGWILAPQIPPNPADSQHLLDVYQLGNDGNSYARLLVDRSDGKQAADLPHAIRPSGSTSYTIGIDAGERLSIGDFIAMANGTPTPQPGLAATAATQFNSPLVDGYSGDLTGYQYYTGSLFAAYLTLDTPSGRASIDADMTSRALQAWPEYGKVTLFAGMVDQQTGGNVMLRFTKRVYGSFHGLVVNASGGISGAQVSVSGGTTGTENLTTDANGYYRSGPRIPSDSQHAVLATLNSGGNTVTAEALTATGDGVDRKWVQGSFRAEVCCDRLFCISPIGFPFVAQFGDDQLLGVEEWRHVLAPTK